LIEAVPAILCALVAGHIVDVNHPRTTYLVCLGALSLNTLALLMLAGGVIPVPFGTLLPWIFAGVFISGVARSFIMPSSFSLLARIVERKDLPSASAWMSSGTQTAMVMGPAIAGLTYGGYGPQGAWMIPVFMVCAAFFMMLFLKTPVHTRLVEARLSAWESIREGWGFILSKPVLLSVMTLDMFAVLFGGAVAMLPAYADQVLHVGSEGLGVLRASPAIGAVLMALFLAVRPMRKISAMRLLWAVTGFGICMIGFGLSKIFLLSVFFLALSGVFDSVSVVIRSTLMQWLTPDRMRGRVSAVNSMFIISSNEIGSFESGVAARYLGLVPSVVVGGFATLLVVGLVSMLSPQFRKTVIDTSKDE
jgi:predicted MFS family arabinose efflux permease